MPVTTQTALSDCVNNNRFSAEFFDPQYVFQPSAKIDWIKIGSILRGCQYGLSIAMNEIGKGYPIVRMNEIDNCFVDMPAKFAAIGKTEFAAFQLKKGDVLFNRTNSFKFVGRTGIVPEDTNHVFASYLIRVNPDEERVLPQYLTVYLNTGFGIGQVKRRAMRSINQANVSASELKQIYIPLAPKVFQQEIAEYVDKSHINMRDSRNLYRDAQGLLQTELGLDKLIIDQPTSYAARYSKILLSKTIAANRIDSESFSPSAIQYEQALSELQDSQPIRFLTGPMIKGAQQKVTPEGNLPYVSIKHIQNREIVAEGNSRRFQGIPIARLNDLLLAITGATIGKIGIVSRYKEVSFSGDMLAIRTNRTINPHYLLTIIGHSICQVQLKRQVTGTTNGHLAPRDVERVLIPRLDEAVEAKIAALTKESIAKVHESERLIELAKQRVQELIERAVAR